MAEEAADPSVPSTPGGRLTGRCGVVTGGGSGIGAAIVERFLAEGARCLALDLEPGALEGAPVVYHRGDVSEEDDVSAAVDLAVRTFGRLDFMVNNAGIVGAVGPITEITGGQWRRTIDVLLGGVFFGTKHAARAMRATGGGAILNVASTAGIRAGLGPHIYTAAKHGVVGLSQSAAAELAEFDIRVNVLAPGATATTILGRAGEVLAPVEQSGFARGSDMAAAATYLVSDEARWVRGAVLVVDGARENIGDRHRRWSAAEPALLGAHGRPELGLLVE